MTLKETEKLLLNCENEIEVEVNIKYNNLKEIIIKNSKTNNNKKNLFVIKLANETLINKQSILKEILKNIYSNCLKFLKANNNYRLIKNSNIIINKLQEVLELLTYINYDEFSLKNIVLNGVLIIKINIDKNKLKCITEKNINECELLNINYIYIGKINNKQYHFITDNSNIFYNIEKILN